MALIADLLTPCSTESVWLSSPLSQKHLSGLRETSIGAARWMSLCKSLYSASPWSLERHRRCHVETLACCRVIESHVDNEDDWPLIALRLRSPKRTTGPASSELSHATPISRHALRIAYWSAAREVHPDRLIEVPHKATQAMTVLNEACPHHNSTHYLCPSFNTCKLLTSAAHTSGVPTGTSSFFREAAATGNIQDQRGCAWLGSLPPLAERASLLGAVMAHHVVVIGQSVRTTHC